jgi:hypothetical protein
VNWRKPKLPRTLRRALRVAGGIALVVGCAVFIPVLVALGRAGYECRVWSSGPAAQQSAQNPILTGISNYTRPEDQTYLTLPEWYIVYSSDEYAAFIDQNPPSRFPYFGAIGQFWQSYYDICKVTRDRYPFNSDYHLVIAVIGTSFTIENIFKGVYENTIGRITEAISSPELTAEDAYARNVATEYGTFLHTIPWYEFPFGKKLSGLWNETPLWGPNIIRKAERKGALSLEYGSKALYGGLIKSGTQSTFEPQNLEILAVVEGLTDAIAQSESQLRIEKRINDRQTLVAIPRYEAFTRLVPRLAERDVRFVEIAGNDEILLTVIAPNGWDGAPRDSETLFAMPILTQPGQQRVALKVPVAALHRVLADLPGSGATLEHIYDY